MVISFQLATYVNPEKLFPKRKGIQAWIIGVAVSAGLLLLLLLIILLWWVSITLICLSYTDLDYRLAVSVGLLLLFLLIILLWWVSITLIYLSYTDLDYRCSCFSRTSFTSSTDHSSMVGKYHTGMPKLYRPGL